MNTKIKVKYLIHAFLFFSLMPYFSFIPLPNTDVQPVFLLIGIFLFIKMEKRFKPFDLFFILVAIYSIIYINMDYPKIEIKKSFNLLFAFLLFYLYRYYIDYLNSKFLYFIVKINFVAIVMHFFAPSLFINTLGHFTRTIKILDPLHGARGASGFSAEPGHMAVVILAYIMIAIYLKDFKNDKKYFKNIIILSFIMLILTKSGSAILYSLIFFSLYFYKKVFNLKVMMSLLTILGPILYYIFTNDSYMGRGIEILKLLFTNPSYVFTHDTSVGQRTINFLVAVLAPYEHPFGLGSFSYDIMLKELMQKYPVFSEIRAAGLGNISEFAKYNSEIGVVFIILIFSIIYQVIKNGFSFQKLAFLVIALIPFVASYSIIFPISWILIVIAMKINSRNNDRTRNGITN